MPLSEDPARLSKSRLRSDLLAHNVALPPANSRKGVYVELHLRHIERGGAADFSSDEDEQTHEQTHDRTEDKVEDGDDPEAPEPSTLTDDDLKSALLQRGVKVGPIVASTRAVYENKLRRLLQSGGRDEQVNGGEENAVLYSDSEDEKEGSEGDKEESVEQSEQSKQEMSQVPNGALSPKTNSRSSFSPQAFSITRMVEEESPSANVPRFTPFPSIDPGCSDSEQQMESRRSASGSDAEEEWRSQPSGRRLPTADRRAERNRTLFYTPDPSPSNRGTKPPVEPANGVLKDIFPTQASPTGIYATRRRPIKGAAGRPVQYAYPDTPASPTTLARREVERRLVPVYIQILVFLAVVVLLYLIYAVVEDSSPDSAVSLLDSPNQASDMEELHAQKATALPEQE